MMVLQSQVLPSDLDWELLLVDMPAETISRQVQHSIPITTMYQVPISMGNHTSLVLCMEDPLDIEQHHIIVIVIGTEVGK
jgi:hypothetical protein